MQIPFVWIFIVALLVGIAMLAPDSEVGGDLRKTGSDAASFTGSLAKAFGRGSRELGGAISE